MGPRRRSRRRPHQRHVERAGLIVVDLGCVPEITVLARDASIGRDHDDATEATTDISPVDSERTDSTNDAERADVREPVGDDVGDRTDVYDAPGSDVRDEDLGERSDATPDLIDSTSASLDSEAVLDAVEATDTQPDLPDRTCDGCSAPNASTVCIDGSCRIPEVLT